MAQTAGLFLPLVQRNEDKEELRQELVERGNHGAGGAHTLGIARRRLSYRR